MKELSQPKAPSAASSSGAPAPDVPTIEWRDGTVVMIDQRKLPWREEYITCNTARRVAEAIRKMIIRGAPAIGVAAAMGLAVGAREIGEVEHAVFRSRFNRACGLMRRARPTAVNLGWAVDRMERLLRDNYHLSVAEIIRLMEEEAKQVLAEDIAANRRLGAHGQELIPDGARILTHCNAGALATGGYGTALGVIRAAAEAGKRIQVLADETRPWLQGSRLTAWELRRLNIPVHLICDNMAGYMFRKGEVDAVIVGADRIAANGDTANKIGTYTVAVLAKTAGVPFYVAAPLSTVDFSIRSGEDIPIEERDPREVTHINGKRVAPEGVDAFCPVFDVTPHQLVTAIITEKGVAYKPLGEGLNALHAL
ncbi:MAG: S-methyl-5-thioribose-1-phosphate isomerase [Pseudomonadota bacterium]